MKRKWYDGFIVQLAFALSVALAGFVVYTAVTEIARAFTQL